MPANPNDANEPPDPFRWCEAGVRIDLAGGSALFTTCAAGDFAPLQKLGQRKSALAAEQVGLPVEAWARDVQVHDRVVRTIRAGDRVVPFSAEADGQATARRDVAVAVQVADCLPIALIAPEAVAVVHAGWRGLSAGVIASGVAALHDLGATSIAAAIGPGAGVCCYATGEEVHAAFAHLGPAVRAGQNADLKRAARALLREQGVDEIHDCGACTICSSAGTFWSFRREGAAAGRQVGVAWRT